MTDTKKQISSGYAVDSYSKTIIGKEALVDKDVIIDLRSKSVFCVADGTGVGIGGGQASDKVRSAVEKLCKSKNFNYSSDVEKNLLGALRLAHKRICDYAASNAIPDYYSSAVILSLNPESGAATIIHAGNCRAYLFRGKVLKALTQDHTETGSLDVPNNSSAPENAGVTRPQLTRALGLKPEFEHEISHTKFRQDDLFVLCSDGISRHLDDNGISKILQELANRDLKTITAKLLAETKRNGALDNASVVLIKIRKFKSKATLSKPMIVLAALVAMFLILSVLIVVVGKKSSVKPIEAVMSTAENQSSGVNSGHGDGRAKSSPSTMNESSEAPLIEQSKPAEVPTVPVAVDQPSVQQTPNLPETASTPEKVEFSDTPIAITSRHETESLSIKNEFLNADKGGFLAALQYISGKWGQLTEIDQAELRRLIVNALDNNIQKIRNSGYANGDALRRVFQQCRQVKDSELQNQAKKKSESFELLFEAYLTDQINEARATGNWASIAGILESNQLLPEPIRNSPVLAVADQWRGIYAIFEKKNEAAAILIRASNDISSKIQSLTKTLELPSIDRQIELSLNVTAAVNCQQLSKLLLDTGQLLNRATSVLAANASIANEIKLIKLLTLIFGQDENLKWQQKKAANSVATMNEITTVKTALNAKVLSGGPEKVLQLMGQQAETILRSIELINDHLHLIYIACLEGRRVAGRRQEEAIVNPKFFTDYISAYGRKKAVFTEGIAGSLAQQLSIVVGNP